MIMANHAKPDKGEQGRFNIVKESNWESDEEPKPSSNDVHARFQLPDKFRIKTFLQTS